MISFKHFSFFVAYNHLFSNQALYACETPIFQHKIGIRSKGFLCQRGIDPGESGNCNGPLLDSKHPFSRVYVSSDGRRDSTARRRKPNLKLFRTGMVRFHCLGGGPPGRIYKGRVCPRIKKIFE